MLFLGNERCWFLHKENHASHINSEYQCNSCDETFPSKSVLMKHRKLRHIHTVKPCSHAFKGDCKFGNEKCWFVHNDIEILGITCVAGNATLDNTKINALKICSLISDTRTPIYSGANKPLIYELHGIYLNNYKKYVNKG